MKMLRKTIKAIVIIVLLKVIMLILDRFSPSSSVFHRHFLFSVQLVVIAWLLLSLLLFAFKAGRSWVARFLPILMVMLILAMDIILSFWMEKPANVPGFLKKEFRDYYIEYERNIIDYEPCSVYDTAYAYKLIPGLVFTFGNIEYKNNYSANSESLRDDEASMDGPQIICAGNSYALGTGVQQNQSFPEMLGAECGKTVLNTGNSSYGTVRQLKRVLSSDTSVLEYLVIQYSRYDVYENESFIKSNDSLKVISEAEYKRAIKDYRWRREYFPGKYAITIAYDFLKTKINQMRKKKYNLSKDPVASAGYFLEVVNNFLPAGNIKIVVTEVSDYADMKNGFLPAVDSLLNQSKYSNLKNRIRTVSVADTLTPQDYYLIDSHLRPSGQQKVAKKIAAAIQ